MQKSNSDILSSEDPAAISELVVRAFTPTRKNRARALGERQLAQAVALLVAQGTVPQLLNAWSAVPCQRCFDAQRLELFKAALRDTDFIRRTTWAHQKISQSRTTNEELVLLYEAFGEDIVAAGEFLVAVAQSCPPMPPAPLYYIPDVPAPLAPR